MAMGVKREGVGGGVIGDGNERSIELTEGGGPSTGGIHGGAAGGGGHLEGGGTDP